jgi:hypothetical protein
MDFQRTQIGIISGRNSMSWEGFRSCSGDPVFPCTKPFINPIIKKTCILLCIQIGIASNFALHPKHYKSKCWYISLDAQEPAP